MSWKSVLITGANRGLGLEFVTQLLALPSPPVHIIAACRAPEKAEELQKLASCHNSIKVIKIDMSDMSAFEAAKKEVATIVQSDGLNVLLNNAGVHVRLGLTEVTEEGMMENYKINVVAPLMLTKAFWPLLKASAGSGNITTVFNVSSVIGSITLAVGGLYPYTSSKAALNMVTKRLSKDFEADDILTCALHPGYVQTDMGGSNATINAVESVAGSIKVMQGMTKEKSGCFFDYNGKELPW